VINEIPIQVEDILIKLKTLDFESENLYTYEKTQLCNQHQYTMLFIFRGRHIRVEELRRVYSTRCWINSETIDFFFSYLSSKFPLNLYFETSFLIPNGSLQSAKHAFAFQKLDLSKYNLIFIPVHKINHFVLIYVDLKKKEI